MLEAFCAVAAGVDAQTALVWSGGWLQWLSDHHAYSSPRPAKPPGEQPHSAHAPITLNSLISLQFTTLLSYTHPKMDCFCIARWAKMMLLAREIIAGTIISMAAVGAAEALPTDLLDFASWFNHTVCAVMHVLHKVAQRALHCMLGLSVREVTSHHGIHAFLHEW